MGAQPSRAGLPGSPCPGWKGLVASLLSGDAFWDPVGLGAFPGGPRAGDGHGSPVRDPRAGEVPDRRCPAARWVSLPQSDRLH